jgi:hypothetical protein
LPKGLPIGAGKYLLVSLLGFVYRELTIVDFPTEGAEIGVEYKLYRERGNIDYLGDNIPRFFVANGQRHGLHREIKVRLAA